MQEPGKKPTKPHVAPTKKKAITNDDNGKKKKNGAVKKNDKHRLAEQKQSKIQSKNISLREPSGRFLEKELKERQNTLEERKIDSITELQLKILREIQTEGLLEKVKEEKGKTNTQRDKYQDEKIRTQALSQKFEKQLQETITTLDMLKKGHSEYVAKIENLKREQIEVDESRKELHNKDEELEKTKLTIDYEIKEIGKEIVEEEKKIAYLNEIRDKAIKKNNDLNEQRLEVLRNLFQLKPYHRRICVFKDNAKTNNFEISNYRNSMSTKVLDKEQIFRFDYIISAFNNPYIPQSVLSNPDNFIKAELTNILSTYIRDDGDIKVEFGLCFYVSENKDKKNFDFISSIVNDLVVENGSRSVVVKVYVNNEIEELKEADEDKIKESEGVLFEIVKEEKVRLMIVNLSYNSNLLKEMISVVTEMEVKKKKSKGKLNPVFISPIVVEINNAISFTPFHSVTVINFDTEKIESQNTFDILNINLKYHQLQGMLLVHLISYLLNHLMFFQTTVLLM